MREDLIMRLDMLGNATSLACDAALDAWSETTEAVLAHAKTATDALHRTLTADPLFAQGHAVKGLMLLTLARAELLAPARQCLALAEAALAARPAPARERAFVEALRLWLSGAGHRAAAILDGVNVAKAIDPLAVKLAHAIRFMLGDNRGMADAMLRIAPHYGDERPLAGFIQGCLAFSLEEVGAYAEAERAGRKAVVLAPRDAWGRHAVAHVMEMTGRARDGLAWLDQGGCDHCNNFGYHIHWHRALFLMELGRGDEALAIYDTAIRAERTDDYRDLANGASLLQRLEFDGVDVGERWDELADIAARRVADRRLVFADLHYLTALLGAGRHGDADRLIAALLDDTREGTSDDAEVARDSGVTTALGLTAFRTGDYPEAARLLLSGRATRQRIGGSHAQRDLFEQVLLECLVRAGDVERADDLLRRRLGQRGTNRFAESRLARLATCRDLTRRVGALVVAATPGAMSHDGQPTLP